LRVSLIVVGSVFGVQIVTAVVIQLLVAASAMK
jgi:hypothetical protein